MFIKLAPSPEISCKFERWLILRRLFDNNHLKKFIKINRHLTRSTSKNVKFIFSGRPLRPILEPTLDVEYIALYLSHLAFSLSNSLLLLLTRLSRCPLSLNLTSASWSLLSHRRCFHRTVKWRRAHWRLPSWGHDGGGVSSEGMAARWWQHSWWGPGQGVRTGRIARGGE